MRSLLLGLVLLVWLLLGYFFHQLQMKYSNANSSDAIGLVDENNANKATRIPGSEVEATESILFKNDNQNVILGESWKVYKDKLLKEIKDGEIMEITGNYGSTEKTPPGFSNMGEARADEARKALGLDKDRVLLTGNLTDDVVDKSNPFAAVSFNNIGKPKTIDESNDKITKIRFPYDSNKKLNNRTVEEYLDKVAKRVIASGEKIRLTGHTDNDGDANYNKNLGQSRANIIGDYLVSKGVKKGQITSLSKGEENPTTSNLTSAGKAENRRTELEIIK